MADILTQIIRNQRHEKAVKQFLNNVNVDEAYMNYANFKLFADAKRTIKFNTVSNNDTRVLNKFCKRWIQLKGDISLRDVRRIQSKVKHYAYKEQNYNCKQRRLQTRAV